MLVIKSQSTRVRFKSTLSVRRAKARKVKDVVSAVAEVVVVAVVAEVAVEAVVVKMETVQLRVVPLPKVDNQEARVTDNSAVVRDEVTLRAKETANSDSTTVVKATVVPHVNDSTTTKTRLLSLVVRKAAPKEVVAALAAVEMAKDVAATRVVKAVVATKVVKTVAATKAVKTVAAEAAEATVVVVAASRARARARPQCRLLNLLGVTKTTLGVIKTKCE
jgi:hypothetical protein